MARKRLNHAPGFLVLLIAILILLTPLLAVALSWFNGIDLELWDHLASSTLLDITVNSISLSLAVCLVTAILGVSLALATTQLSFPFSRILSVLLIFPMSFPAYVLAFIYSYHLDDFSPGYVWLAQFAPGLAEALVMPKFAKVVLAMSLALYPYIYLVVRQGLLTQGVDIIDAAKTLGKSSGEVLTKLTLPMLAPWILGGTALVAMETLADFGAVSTFAFDTYTTAIYKAWYGFFSPVTASQLSTFLMLIVFVVVSIQSRAEKFKKYHSGGKSMTAKTPVQGLKGWLLTAFCGLPVVLGLVLPIVQLLVWAMADLTPANLLKLWPAFRSSIGIALITAAVATAVGLLFSFAFRGKVFNRLRPIARAALMGYAIPGSVLALGVYLPVVAVEQWLSPLAQSFGIEGGFLSSTLVVLVFGLVVRFLTLTYSTITQAHKRIPDDLAEAAATLGIKGTTRLTSIYLPLLKKGLLTGCLLVFVDTMKELPLTLMTRPFGWDTIAVKIFQYTAEGDWDRAALPALVLFCSGLVPVAMLMREMERNDA